MLAFTASSYYAHVVSVDSSCELVTAGAANKNYLQLVYTFVFDFQSLYCVSVVWPHLAI